jgi:uncharacterized protein YigE (DUF2233 family)
MPPVTWSTVHHEAACEVATVDLREASLRLVAARRLDEALALPGAVAVTNAGLYHTPEVPVGWTVIDGVQTRPIERGEGVGNFFLQPNGAFWLDGAGPHVARTARVAATGAVTSATQSGPLLVEGGALHPAFRADATSRKVRNGIGVVDGHTVVLARCEPLTFFAFATLFRDVLHAPDALFLDGTISVLAGPDTAVTSAARAQDFATFLVVTAR